MSSSFLVPDFAYDIFISYSKEDDDSILVEEGWVKNFHKSLEILLRSRFGKDIKIWRGSSLESGLQIDQTIENIVTNSALFLALTSTSFLNKKYCLRELQWFYEKAKIDRYGIQIGLRSRIINVLINNIPCDKWPKEFCRIMSLNFYESESEEDIGWPLEKSDQNFNKQLKKLADTIYKTLIDFKDSIINSTENGKESTIENKKDKKNTIFFADVSEPLCPFRSLAISKLSQEGFNIVTNIPPPYKATVHQDRVISELKNSMLSVHLLDEFSGTPVEDEPTTTYRQKQVEIGMRNAKSQIIWIPKELDFETIENKNYKNFLESLVKGNGKRDRYEFIKGSRSSLAIEIKEKIEQLQSIPEIYDGLKTVLIDTHLKDQTYALDLSQLLISRNIQPIILPQLNNPQLNLEIFENWLKQVNAFIILFGQVNENWVRERLAYALQLYVSKKLPLKLFSIYLAPPEKPDLQTNFNFGLINIDLIDNSKSNKPDIGILDSALRKLKIGA